MEAVFLSQLNSRQLDNLVGMADAMRDRVQDGSHHRRVELLNLSWLAQAVLRLQLNDVNRFGNRPFQHRQKLQMAGALL